MAPLAPKVYHDLHGRRRVQDFELMAEKARGLRRRNPLRGRGLDYCTLLDGLRKGR